MSDANVWWREAIDGEAGVMYDSARSVHTDVISHRGQRLILRHLRPRQFLVRVHPGLIIRR